jgi:hypothetical protein
MMDGSPSVTDSQPDTPIVRRAVFALAPGRRRQVLEVLWYIEHRHHWIDPDMFKIELDEVATLKRIFGESEEEPPSTISVTNDEIFSLETCVMAADAYAHRRGERQLCALTDEEFAEVGAWVAQTHRWFITPLRET